MDSNTFEHYGRVWGKGTTALQIELTCYRYAPPGEKKFLHCKNAFALLFPHRIATWNSWSEKIMRGFCDESRVGGGILSVIGAAGCGKSDTVGYLMTLDFLAAPDDTLILCASDTIANLDKRVWKYSRAAYRGLPFEVGHFKQSKPESIVSDNDEGGLQCVALENDPSSEKLKGFHPKRLRIVIDEGTAINKAPLSHWQNWTAAGKEFCLIVLSNFKGFDNLCAEVSEPVHGYQSIDYNLTDIWKSKLGGTVILLDALKSPVYLNPELQTTLPFLRTKKEIDDIIHGTEDQVGLGENHPRVMQYIRSIPVYDEGEKTILTQKMLTKGGASLPAKWAGWGRTDLLALDPSFVTGGDECILQRGLLGYENDGEQVLEFTDTISIPLNSSSPIPTEYQIMDFLTTYCEKEEIPPENVATDAAGQGRGLGSILHYDWSPRVMLLQPGNAPTDKIVDWTTKPPKTAKEIYDRYVTELWYDMRLFVETAQIRGLPKVAASEFCTRIYDDSKVKTRLETKPEYKLRISGMDSVKGSPDRSDACTYLLALAQEHGFKLANRKRAYAHIVPVTRESQEQKYVQDWVDKRNQAWADEQNRQSDDALEYTYGGEIVD